VEWFPTQFTELKNNLAMITVKILADSINPSGSRLTSFLLTYPRFIHSEFNTHRAFSRNAASSRAIPLSKMLAAIHESPAMPERWGAEQKGMQSGDSVEAVFACMGHWLNARNKCADSAELLAENGLHKSLCNRLIEPWAHITVIATASDIGLENFFALRAHPAAQPEFQVLAYRMLATYIQSKSKKLGWGDWHIPHFEGATLNAGESANWPVLLKVATARCARLSYLTFDGEHSVEKDIELHDRLAASGHWSPFEHCAQAKRDLAIHEISNFDVGYMDGGSGWLQYRKKFSTECQGVKDLQALLSTKPDWISL